jgi:hypothetical protein
MVAQHLLPEEEVEEPGDLNLKALGVVLVLVVRLQTA